MRACVQFDVPLRRGTSVEVELKDRVSTACYVTSRIACDISLICYRRNVFPFGLWFLSYIRCWTSAGENHVAASHFFIAVSRVECR